MSNSALVAGIRLLRDKLAQQGRHEESDEQLLHAFTSRRDDNAFAVLVRRHGPMVLHACRRVLGNEQDAEDAFQATFLVLARNASSSRIKTTLAGFLYGTAHRTAMKAKQSAARRRKHEGQALSRPPVDPADELSWREVRTLLDEEIARLPEIYRSVFVLCCLENLSQAEAGRHVGLKERTVSRRLAAARKRLAWRLARRGVELTAALAATALGTTMVSAAPPMLVATTVKAALATAASEGLAGAVSASVAELVHSGTAAMMASKAKIATMVLLAMTLLAGASVWAYRAVAVNTLPSSSQPVEPLGSKRDEDKAASPKPEMVKTLEIKGRVLDPEGKLKAGAKVLLLGEDKKIAELGITTADGRFSVLIPQIKEGSSLALIAQADDAGIDFIDLGSWKLGKPIELRLVKDRVIRGRIVNTEGKPVAGARLTVENVGIGDNKSMDSFLSQWKKKPPGLQLPGGIQFMAPRDSRHERVALFTATTDAEGRFAFRGLGEERFVWLHLSGDGIAAKELWVINRGGFDPEPYNQAVRDRIPKGFERRAASEMLRGPGLSVIAEAEKVIRGIVKDADSGKGRPNMVVHLSHAGNRSVEVPLQARTDAEGRYQIRGVHKAISYTLEVAEDATLGYMPSRLEATDTIGYRPVIADIKVKKGVIIRGKMIDRASGKPLRGFVESAVLVGNPFVKDYPPFDLSGWFLRKETDANGNFAVVAIPGPVLLMGGPRDSKTSFFFQPSIPDPKYPHYFDTTTFGPGFPSLIDFQNGIRPIQGNFCKVLEIKSNAKVVKQDIVLERSSALPVRIQDAEGKPLTDAWVSGSTARNFYPLQCKEAECSAYQMEPGKPRLMVFYHRERNLAGTLTLKGDEKPPVATKLVPASALKGRLLDTDGKPLAEVIIEARYHDRQSEGIDRFIHEAKQIVTDRSGDFRLDELIPQSKFELSFRRGKRRFERETKCADSTIQVQPGECRDLGTIKLKLVPENDGE